MNRNEMYNYLKGIGLHPVMHYRQNGSYHVEFRNNADSDEKIDAIILDWGYVTGFSSIYLCANEIVLKGDFGFSQINMQYYKIEKFEVRLIES